VVPPDSGERHDAVFTVVQAGDRPAPVTGNRHALLEAVGALDGHPDWFPVGILQRHLAAVGGTPLLEFDLLGRAVDRNRFPSDAIVGTLRRTGRDGVVTVVESRDRPGGARCQGHALLEAVGTLDGHPDRFLVGVLDGYLPTVGRTLAFDVDLLGRTEDVDRLLADGADRSVLAGRGRPHVVATVAESAESPFLASVEFHFPLEAVRPFDRHADRLVVGVLDGQVRALGRTPGTRLDPVEVDCRRLGRGRGRRGRRRRRRRLGGHAVVDQEVGRAGVGVVPDVTPRCTDHDVVEGVVVEVTRLRDCLSSPVTRRLAEELGVGLGERDVPRELRQAVHDVGRTRVHAAGVVLGGAHEDVVDAVAGHVARPGRRHAPARPVTRCLASESDVGLGNLDFPGQGFRAVDDGGHAGLALAARVGEGCADDDVRVGVVVHVTGRGHREPDAAEAVDAPDRQVRCREVALPRDGTVHDVGSPGTQRLVACLLAAGRSPVAGTDEQVGGAVVVDVARVRD